MFTEIGWNKWQSSVHENQEQIDRYHSAKDKGIKLISYDDTTREAIIKGSSGKEYIVSEIHCECEDFKFHLKKEAPCKHMYYLAMQLYNRKLTKGSET